MILDLRGGKCEIRGDCGRPYPRTAPKLLVSRLGRFKTAGNKGVHRLGIVDVATGAWIVGGNASSGIRGRVRPPRTQSITQGRRCACTQRGGGRGTEKEQCIGGHRGTGVACVMHFADLDFEPALSRAKAARPAINPIGGLPEILRKLEKARKIR